MVGADLAQSRSSAPPHRDGAGGWQLRVCGDVTLTAPDGRVHAVRGSQPGTALAMLAIEGRAVRRDELAHEFWGVDRLPAHWKGAVRGVIAKVRAQLVRAGLPPESLEADAGLIALRLPERLSVDVDQAATWARDAELALSAGDHALAIERARAASRIVAQPIALDGEGDWHRRLHQRADWVATAARHVEVEALLARSQVREALAVAESTVAVEPLDEKAHEQVVRAHLAGGRPLAARHAYDAFRDLLRDELGAEPPPELTALVTPEDGPVGRPDRHRRAERPRDGAPAPVDRFLGRHREMEAAMATWSEAIDAASPRLLVIEGPAGIGKTRLAREVMDRAAASGARHLWGRCHAASGVPFEPYQDAARTNWEQEKGVTSWMAAAPAGVARLLPELAEELAGRPLVADDRGAVLRDVIATVAAFAAVPGVLVLDDYQWASGDTAALTERLLAELHRPLLVVLTVRTGVAAPTQAAQLAEVLRAAPATVLQLAGLDAHDLSPVAAELRSLGGRSASDVRLAQLLHERTGGHPFFVGEIVRDAHRSGQLDLTRTPEVARSWVRARLGALAPEETDVVEHAAILGSQVDVAVLSSLVEVDDDRVVDVVERLVHLGFFVEEGAPGRMAFPHEITREVVEEGIGATRRATLHRRVADRLTELVDAPGRAAEAAAHYGLAGPPARDLAVDWGRRAASHSLDHSAWDLAVEQLTTALELAEDPRQRARLLVMLGRAQHGLGRPTTAVAHLEEATSLARQHHLPIELADATRSLVGRGGRGAAAEMEDRERVTRLTAALEGLDAWVGDDDEADGQEREGLRIALEGELAWGLLFTAEPSARRRLVAESLARTRRRSDAPPQHLAMALLNARQAKHLPTQLGERLADLDEILDLPRASLTSDVVVTARLYGHEDLLRLGRRDEARRWLALAEEAADAHGHPYWRWAVATWASLSTVLDGDLAAAEERLVGSMALQTGPPPEALACLGVQLVAIRLFQGRAGEVVDQLGEHADANPAIPCYRAVQALCATEAGDLALAERLHAGFAHADFANIPDDPNRMLSLAVLGDVAATLGDQAAVRRLRDLLVPHAGHQVVLNCYGGGGAHWGPVTRILARGAATTGDHDLAARWFEQAEAEAIAAGARLMIDRVRRDRDDAR